MCHFFGFCSDGFGKTFYFNKELRDKVVSGEIKGFDPDSHTSILTYFGIDAREQDTYNYYEYDPLRKELKVDQINTFDDSSIIERWLKKLNFQEIRETKEVEEFIGSKPNSIKDPKRVLFQLLEKPGPYTRGFGESLAKVTCNIDNNVLKEFKEKELEEISKFFEKLNTESGTGWVNYLDCIERLSQYFLNAVAFHTTLSKYKEYRNFYDRMTNFYKEESKKSDSIHIQRGHFERRRVYM